MRDYFLFAHQDDEFGVFHAIERSAQAGRRPVCLYFTNGDFGGQDVEVRNRESRQVLAALGVASEDCVFLGQQHDISDGRLVQSLPRAYAGLRQVVAEKGPATSLYTLAYEGGHQDHDAVYVLACALMQEAGIARAWQFSLYHGRGFAGPWFRVLNPVPENGAVHCDRIFWSRRWRHLFYCLRYFSQWRSWVGLYPFVVGHYFLDGRQALQPVDPGRCRERPHAGALLYERRGNFLFEEFQRLSGSFLDERLQRSLDAPLV